METVSIDIRERLQSMPQIVTAKELTREDRRKALEELTPEKSQELSKLYGFE